MIPSHLSPFAALVAVALAGCATVAPAEIALPAAIGTDAAVVPIVGINAGRSGQFSIGPYSGSYRRSHDRLALFDRLLVRNSGHVDFELDGPDQPRRLAATCRFGAASSGIGVVEVDHAPLRFECRFSGDAGTAESRLLIAETRDGLADALMRRSRQGELVWGGQRITVKSVHSLAGSPLQTATPMGYSFAVGDRSIGAVSLANRRTVHVAASASEADRQAVLAGAVALALLWDPADVEPAGG
jgi:hypothetical protein